MPATRRSESGSRVARSDKRAAADRALAKAYETVGERRTQVELLATAPTFDAVSQCNDFLSPDLWPVAQMNVDVPGDAAEELRRSGLRYEQWFVYSHRANSVRGSSR